MNKTRAGLGAVMTGGLLATSLISASPATAASDRLEYTCPVPVLGDQPFFATLDSNAPETIAVGETVDTVTAATFEIPASLTSTLVGLGAVTYAGTTEVTAFLDGVEAPFTMDVLPGQVAAPLVVTAAGASGPVTGTEAGDVLTLESGGFVSELSFLTAAGGDALAVLGGSPAIACVLAAGQDAVIDRITVVKAGSTTQQTAAYKARKDRVVSKAAVTGDFGNDPTGRVRVVLKKGSKVLDRVKVVLNDRNVARTVFKGVKKRGQYTVVATYLGDERLERSKGTATFRVR